MKAVSLDSSVAVEIQIINDALKRIPVDKPTNTEVFQRQMLLERRKETVAVYRLHGDAKKALKRALDSNSDVIAWDKAYLLAQRSDDSMRGLLRGKVLAEGRSNSGSYQIYLIGFMLVLANWSAGALTSIDPETINLITESALGLILIYCQIPPLLGLLEIEGIIGSYPNLSNKVLSSVQEAGVSLNILADNDSLISQLMSARNNALELERIDHQETLPNEITCPISRDVLTDPVYCDKNPERFERSALLAWLKVNSVHPLTKEKVCASEFKRDFQCKLEADDYVDRSVAGWLKLSKFAENKAESETTVSAVESPEVGPK